MPNLMRAAGCARFEEGVKEAEEGQEDKERLVGVHDEKKRRKERVQVVDWELHGFGTKWTLV